MVFAIVYAPGPCWKPGLSVWEQPLEAHGDYHYRLWSEGRVLHSGPFSDGSGAMSVVQVSNRLEAEALMEADPAVVSGLLTAQLRPWFPVDWATYEPSTATP